MAFSTELVLAAQTGPGVEYWTVPTSARTVANSTWTTLLTTSVGAGTWLMVVDVRNAGGGALGQTDIRADGTTESFACGDSGASATTPMRFMKTIIGPKSVTVDARYLRISAGTAHFARIG